MKDDFESYETTTTTVPPVAVTTKKRKRVIADDGDDILRQKARLFAKTPEAWRSVSKYSATRLREYVEEHEHQQQQHLYETIFDFTHKILGVMLDKISKGDGYVQREIEADITIRQCIEMELQNWVQFLSNRYKAVACLGIDVVNGKKRQLSEATVIIEENGCNEAIDVVVQPIVEINNEINTEEWRIVSGTVDKQAPYLTSMRSQGQREIAASVSVTIDGL